MKEENINNINDNNEELKHPEDDTKIINEDSKVSKEINIENILEKVKQNEEIINKLQEVITNINKKNEENKTIFNNEIAEIKKKNEIISQLQNDLQHLNKIREEDNNIYKKEIEELKQKNEVIDKLQKEIENINKKCEDDKLLFNKEINELKQKSWAKGIKDDNQDIKNEENKPKENLINKDDINKIKNEIEKELNTKLKEIQTSFNKKINENEEDFKKEINSLKQILENKINAKADEFPKKNIDKNEIIENNNNNDEVKRKREFNVMKKDLKDLNEKFNDFERVFDNKLDFIETSLSKILDDKKEDEEKQKIEKQKEENKKTEMDLEWANNKAGRKTFFGAQNSINIDALIKADLKSKEKQEAKDLIKQFENLLDKIFSEENLKYKDIKKEDEDKFINLANKLLKYNVVAIEVFSLYLNKIRNNISDNYFDNLNSKKNKIFQIVNNMDEQHAKKNKGLLLGLFGGKGEKKDNKKNKNDIKDFDINDFRKEFNLDEKEFPNNLIKEAYKKYNGDKNKMFTALVLTKK